MHNGVAHDRGKKQVEAWIKEARLGSPEAVGNLLEACRGYLLRIANQELPELLQAKIGASDLVQDTALEAHRNFASFQGTCLEELLGWLRRILLNNSANVSRSFQGTSKRQVFREISWDNPAGRIEGLEDAGPSPSSIAVATEQQQGVERALSHLRDDLKTVILLRNRELYTFAEIGIEMGRSAEAARKLWAHAIDVLQKELRRTHERA